ncbi:MAG: GNAT family protein [Myxococcota bacterium]|nr:GNAT family protein [Myxococcota bacterium]
MTSAGICALTILDGPGPWVGRHLDAMNQTGAHHFDARAVGADLVGVRAVVDEFYRMGGDDLFISMPHGEDDVQRVAFALRQSVKQNVHWLTPAFASPAPVADWRPVVKPIPTRRLELVHPTPAQIDEYYKEIVGTNIFDTILWEGPKSPDDLHDFWLHGGQNLLLKQCPPVQCAVIEKASQRYIGGCGLRPIGQNYEVLDLGYAFAEAYHGHGYATEATTALINYGFGELGARRISGEVFEGNMASVRVLEKLGFQREGTHRQSINKRGRWMDSWIYAMTRMDWDVGRLAREPS